MKRARGLRPGCANTRQHLPTLLKVGDPVMVITGGNQKKHKVLKGATGKVLRFIPKRGRLVVEGVNTVKRHKRAQSSTDSSGIITKEGSLPLSNVMYYSEALKRPVRLRMRVLDDGRKVRGYLNKKNNKFEQIDI